MEVGTLVVSAHLSANSTEKNLINGDSGFHFLSLHSTSLHGISLPIIICGGQGQWIGKPLLLNRFYSFALLGIVMRAPLLQSLKTRSRKTQDLWRGLENFLAVILVSGRSSPYTASCHSDGILQ